ncbi:MAG: hypothetical protein ABIQ11_04000 [Saprospiraceae bacterium]
MKSLLLSFIITALCVSCQSKTGSTDASNDTVVVENTKGADTTRANSNENTASDQTADDKARIEPPAGGITIDELFANKKKYDGQTVRIKGRCVKLNSMIMDRNWVHLQDGSMGNSDQDLTVTTTENVALGAIVAFEGKITLDKDFGSGYKYDVIMEDARLIQ